ncbi:hypothetical protein [Sphingomonas sp. BK345]|uniref:hypothetical protein n=1 Tax=Sphingomonas sp. BK345 TaxID=2586980 RepID=UPI00160E25E8|nr:hypothetical protein [Sphingomonas sp. BK345]MBB3472947.1 hypothetical protein [Sphingomonas sp. BK345]
MKTAGLVKGNFIHLRWWLTEGSIIDGLDLSGATVVVAGERKHHSRVTFSHAFCQATASLGVTAVLGRRLGQAWQHGHRAKLARTAGARHQPDQQP